MLLRKLVAALCPLLLCIVLCLLYRWLDGVLGAGLFWSFLLKGLLLGVMLALIIRSFRVAAFPLYPEWSGHSGRRGRRRIYDRHRPAFQALTPLKRIKSPLSSTDRRKRVFHIF